MEKVFQVALFMLFFGLTIGKAQQKTLSINVGMSPSQNITDLFEIRKVIPLETTANSLIRHVFSLKIRNDSIYILSGNWNKIASNLDESDNRMIVFLRIKDF